jgi:signal transduction histidine kinase
MTGPGGKRALLAAWAAIEAATYPEGAFDADGRRAFEHEAEESNARIARWFPFVAVPVNALAIVALRRGAEDEVGAAWTFWLVSLSAAFAAIAVLIGIVAWRRRPAALWRASGELLGVVGLLLAAARSANAQRAHPNINVFIGAAFATAFFLRLRPGVFAAALLGAGAVVLGGMVRFQPDGGGRVADEVVLLGACTIALFGFFVARSARVRELLARRQVESLNERLERDIDERKRAEEALREAKVAADAANRAKSAFLANMSHEIRTPMNAVLGYTQLLQRDPGLPVAQQQQHLEVIRRSGDHLLSVITDVLDMAKIEAGFLELHRGVVDVGRLLEDVERMFRLRTNEKGLSFEVHEGPGVPRRIVGDEGRLRQILVNLLGNAVKFTEQGGVAVRVLVVGSAPSPAGEASAARLLVEVEDTGPGIDADQVGGLFRPFAQVHAGIYGHGGAGLGLALSRDFAQLMGGDVTLESRPSVGSVFRLEIPLELADIPSAAPVPPVVGVPTGPAPAPAPAPPSPIVVLKEQAAAFPAALASELSGAVQVADYDQIIALLARFPDEHAAAVASLRALAQQYRYDDIAAVLRR